MTPKVSLNKLGEYYSQDNAARRRTIIKDQIKKNPASAPAYYAALPAIAGAGLGHGFDSGKILLAIENLEKEQGGTPWAQTNRANTVLALKHWQEIGGRLPIPNGLTITKGEHSPPKMLFGEVVISVRPDFLIRGMCRGQQVLGGIKVHFAKNPKHRLPKEGGECVATLMQRYLESQASEGEIVKPGLCFSIEVFAEKVVSAPKSQTLFLKTIKASLQEYGAVFQSLEKTRN